MHGINPATLEELPPVPVSTAKDIDAAVKAARAAFKSWKQISFEERKICLRSFAAGLLSLKSEFAQLLTTEQGKPVRPPCVSEFQSILSGLD